MSQCVSLRSTADGLWVAKKCLNSVRRVFVWRRPFAFHCTIVVDDADLLTNMLAVWVVAYLYLLLLLQMPVALVG